MTDPSEPAIDPSWWRTLVNADTALRMVSLSRSFNEPARDATDELQGRVLSVLAITTSAMLQPSKWNEPFRPMAVMDGFRSPLPSDLDEDQRSLLRRIAHTMNELDSVSLRARVCDVGWFYGGRADIALLDKAIAAYSAVPLTPNVWRTDGRDEWQRGLELAIRRGTDGRPQLRMMTAALLDGVRSAEGSEGFFGVHLMQMVRTNRLVDRDERSELATLCVCRAAEARVSANRNLEQAWEQEATIWFQGLNLRDDAAAAQVRRAESLAAEAEDRRQGVGGAAMTAAHFVEGALKALREVPRAYRVAHDLDSRIAELRAQLGEDRQLILEAMVPIHSDPIDLSEQAADARSRVTGLELIPALVALGLIAPIESVNDAITRAREELQEHSFSAWFGSESYSSTGQKVSSRSTADLTSTPGTSDELDDATWSAMIRDHGILTNLIVAGRIVPALESVTLQHWYPPELLYDLCRRNPLIPSGREWSWARGILHGLNGDFHSAVGLLVPQIEHLVRLQLKQAGVHTLLTDERGVETEKGLASLLDDAKCADVLGADLRFALKAVLTAHEGPNLRNNIAHGLASDGDFYSYSVVYVWWLALRTMILPWAPRADDAEAPEDPEVHAADEQTGETASEE